MAVQFFQVMCNATHIVHHAISSRCLHARHRHGDTMDVSTHSAHSMDLLSRCIEHGSVDTARTAVHAVHRRRITTSFRNMMFHLESELSSVSVLSCRFLIWNLLSVVHNSRFMSLMRVLVAVTYLRTRCLASQTKVIDLRKTNLWTCRQLLRNPHSGGYCAAFLLSVCLRPS